PPRLRNAATRPSSMPCPQCSLSRHGAPGPVGSGRRMAKSTGTTSLPSPITTTSKTPSIPESTRCSCPLHQVPTRPNCSPYFFEHRVIAHPGPLPAAARGRTRVGCVAPQWGQHLEAQASEALDPGAFGERTEQAGGEIFIPTSYAAQFGIRTAPEQWRAHHPDDFPQQRVFTTQAPFILTSQ